MYLLYFLEKSNKGKIIESIIKNGSTVGLPKYQIENGINKDEIWIYFLYNSFLKYLLLCI